MKDNVTRNDAETVREHVRTRYGEIARTPAAPRETRAGGCCGCGPTGCAPGPATADDVAKRAGYNEAELATLPEGANMGLSCGNPTALASLKPGEVVVDLGSGGGFDCFLAGPRVGPTGRVIGVDMTADMIAKARKNAVSFREKAGLDNVEFRLGEIENLPVADNSVDVVISNCVINLSTDKKRVFQEGFRALKPGGRLMISDIVLLKELPDAIKDSVTAYVGCVSGAMLKEDYLKAVKAAGFRKVKILQETAFPIDFIANDPTAVAIAKSAGISLDQMRDTASSVLSIKVSGVKP